MKKIIVVLFVVFAVLSSVSAAHASLYTVDLVDKDYPTPPYSMFADISGDGTMSVDITLGMGTGTLADIRAFYFDYVTASGSTITVSTEPDITAWFDTYAGGQQSDISSAVKLNGATNHPFNVGIEFGDEGIGVGKGDIRSTSFALISSSAITLGDFFGGRLTSVENAQGARTDSSKLTGEKEEPPTTGVVPEPTTLMLFSSALVGAFVKKRMIG